MSTNEDFDLVGFTLGEFIPRQVLALRDSPGRSADLMFHAFTSPVSRGYGSHPLCAFVDHGAAGTGGRRASSFSSESVRPGRAEYAEYAGRRPPASLCQRRPVASAW